MVNHLNELDLMIQKRISMSAASVKPIEDEEADAGGDLNSKWSEILSRLQKVKLNISSMPDVQIGDDVQVRIF